MDTNPQASVCEAYRTLRTNLEYSSVSENHKVIMFTSAQNGDAKAVTAINLAIAFAQTNKKVLIIDADLRNPRLQTVFAVNNSKGLATVLGESGEAVDSIQPTHIDMLYALPAGPIPSNPSELLSSPKLSMTIEELRRYFDLMILIAPAATLSDPYIVASRCDGVLLVIDSGKVGRRDALKIKNGLNHVKAHVLGVVLNQ